MSDCRALNAKYYKLADRYSYHRTRRRAYYFMHTFLQSIAWEKFNQAMGSKTWRVDGVLVIKIVARRGTYLLVPHATKFPEQIIVLGRSERCNFIRVCPLMPDTPENRLQFKSLKFKRAPIHVHPEFSWLLNIDQPDEVFFVGMRKTTRYSIKKAQKDGIMTEISTNPNDIERFWKLYKQTAERQQFVPFSKEYIEMEFRAFGEQAFWVFSEHAAAMIVMTEDEAFYHHGASTHHPTASYAVQWAAIQEAKRRGKVFYNFWGVWDNPNHPQWGLSQFKRGFGGFQESYVPTQDLPLRARYWFNYIIEQARKLQRGF